MSSLQHHVPKLFQCVLLFVVLLEAARAHAFGPRIEMPPAIGECLANSQYVVAGKVESVLLTESYEADFSSDHSPVTRIRCDIAVEDVLYGDEKQNMAGPGQVKVGKTIAVEQKIPSNRLHCRPAIGQEAVVYICPRKDDEVGVRTIYYAEPIKTNEFNGQPSVEGKEHVEAVRLIGRIWLLITAGGKIPASEAFRDSVLHGVAKLVQKGCSSDNVEYQKWCLRVLAGKTGDPIRDKADPLRKIHEHVDAAEVSSLIQKVCAQKKDDYAFGIFCDDLLEDDTNYWHSNERYEFLWHLLECYRTENASENHRRADDILETRLLLDFPDRVNDSLDRLMKLVDNPKQQDRGLLLISMRQYLLTASKDVRNKVVDFVEHKLQDPALDEEAVYTLAEFAETEIRATGKVSERLKAVIENAEMLPQESKSQLIEVRKKHPGLFEH